LPNKSGAPRGTRALIVLASVAIAAYALDQLSKFLVESNLTLGEQVRVLGDVLVVQNQHIAQNPGAAFSLASGSTWIFSILAAVVTVVIIVFARKIRSVGWAVVFGLLLGGVLGNLTDRLFREPSFGLGHVVDFISTPWMLPAIYNVADICIVTSMGLFILLTLRGINMDGTRSISAKRAAAEAKDLADAEPAARSTDEPLR
jgi:signal peptidase II